MDLVVNGGQRKWAVTFDFPAPLTLDGLELPYYRRVVRAPGWPGAVVAACAECPGPVQEAVLDCLRRGAYTVETI